MHLALAVAALAPFTPAQACGACAEDKVAATYDHAIASRAAAQGRTMVFCEVRGPFDAKRLKAAATRIDGLDPASVRTSANPATVSFSLDSRKVSIPSAVKRLQATVPAGTQLLVVELPGRKAGLTAGVSAPR
jgi:hypothetical protein